MGAESTDSSLQAASSASVCSQVNKREAMSRSVSGELLSGPQKVNFPGSFFGPWLPLIDQIDDNQIGGKSPGRVLAIVIDLHPGDVF